jgi:hypothetical protein
VQGQQVAELWEIRHAIEQPRTGQQAAPTRLPSAKFEQISKSTSVPLAMEYVRPLLNANEPASLAIFGAGFWTILHTGIRKISRDMRFQARFLSTLAVL